MRKHSIARSLVFLVIGLLGLVATARALPTVGGCIFYFSDATYTTQVGSKCWWCGSGIFRTGTVTQYIIVDNPFEQCDTFEYVDCSYDPLDDSLDCGPF